MVYLGPGGKCRPTGFRDAQHKKCRSGRSLPCPRSHHVKAKPMLMLLIERNVRKIRSSYLGCFELWNIPVLSSLIENETKTVPSCADGVPVRGSRAGTGTSSQLGAHFGFLRTRKVKKPRRAVKNGVEHGSLRRLSTL